MAVPNTFAFKTGSVPLSELDTNFATPITIGSTSVALGATATSLSGVTLQSPTLVTPTLGTPTSGTLTNCTIPQLSSYPTTTSLSASTGSTLIGTTNGGAGSVTRTVASKLNDTVSVKDFGAVGDGLTDDTSAIQSALNSLAATVLFPAGKYLISSTLIPAMDQTLLGYNNAIGPNPTTGTIIYLAPTMNSAGVKFTNRGTIRNICVQGNSGYTYTNQKLIYINNTLFVTVDGCMLVGGYDNIYIDGTSFYITLLNCTVYAAFHSQLYVNSVSSAGVDLILSTCRFLALPITATSAMIFEGLGSLLATNVQVSSESVISGGTLIDFKLKAPFYGGAQFTNCVFEVAGTTTDCITFQGATQWSQVYFTNCQINGAAGGGAAIVAKNIRGLVVVGSVLSGISSNGTFYIPTGSTCTDFMFSCVDFEGDSGITPNQCGTTGTISGSFIGCRWTGSSNFINYSTLPAGSVTRLDVIGGNVKGVVLTSPTTIPGSIILDSAVTLSQNINGLTIGYGNNNILTNTVVGVSALGTNVSAVNNTAFGYGALQNNTANGNTAIGSQTLISNTTGVQNTAVGNGALTANIAGNGNVGVGQTALTTCTGSYNTGVGILAGATITTGSNNVILGAYQGGTAPISATGSNYIVLSDGAANVRQTIDPNGHVIFTATERTAGYTVATLPTGVTGMRAYVTNALTPVWGSTVVTGGAVTVPVFYNGSNWIVG